MDVQLANNVQFTDKSLKVKNDAVKRDEVKKEAAKKEAKADPKTDAYEHVQTGKKITYDKPEVKPGTKTIQQLQEEINRVHEHVKQLVIAMFQRQGLEFQDLSDIKIEDLKNIKIDETARKEAEAMIADGGELSAENVSNRIVDFAKALSGGDRSKLDPLKAAIDEAYGEVKKQFGDEELPELTQKTYQMIMDKLNAWGNEAPATGEREAAASVVKPKTTEPEGKYVKIEIVEKSITIESYVKPR